MVAQRWQTDVEIEYKGGTGSPHMGFFSTKPRDLAKLENVVVGLQGFIDYWQSIRDHNMTKAYRSLHGHLLQYWTGVKEALHAPLTDVYTTGLPLREGSSPCSRFEGDAYPVLHTGELREEHQPDDQYVGHSNLHLAPVFHSAENVHKCRAPLHEECPKHHGHKGDPGVTPETCGVVGKRAQVILVWVGITGIGNASHPQK